MSQPHRSLPRSAAATPGRRWLAAPLLLCLALLWMGASSETAAADCPDDAKRDDARVQLWSESDCEGDTVSVGSGPAIDERPNFEEFADMDGEETWFETKTSSLAVAAGSCVRLFENAGFGGATYPLVCAAAGSTEYVSTLDDFDNDASSMRICSTQVPSDCDAPRPPAPPPPGPAPAPAPDCTAAGTTAGLQLRAWARGSRSVVTTRSGRSPRIRGRLTRADGSPIGGAPICVGTKGTAPGAVAAIAGSVTTDAAGRFTYRAPAGSSRRLTFVFRGAEGTASDSVLMRVRAPVSLRASKRALRNGEVLRLRGRAPRSGLLVEIQARRATGWQTFLTTRSRRDGRFRLAYQFTRTVGVHTYRLRARVPFQPTLPYAPGASRSVRVRVAG